MQKYNEVSETSRKKIIINNFIGGISWALGSTIGLTIFATLVTFLLGKIDLIPVIGSYIAKLNAFIVTHPHR
jgi:predicted PurR-regulated permease PerM